MYMWSFSPSDERTRVEKCKLSKAPGLAASRSGIENNCFIVCCLIQVERICLFFNGFNIARLHYKVLKVKFLP